MKEKVYLFKSSFYDKNNVSYAGAFAKRVFKSLDDAYKYTKDIHDRSVSEYVKQGIKISSNIKRFDCRIKFSFIIDDGVYAYINSIEELELT